MEFKQKPMRPIEIKATANGGYLIHVGCTHFAYTDEEAMIADLGEYIRDPQGVEEEYNKHHKAYDDVSPESPSMAGQGSISSREPEAFEQLPELEPTDEKTDPAEDIESSSY